VAAASERLWAASHQWMWISVRKLSQ